MIFRELGARMKYPNRTPPLAEPTGEAWQSWWSYCDHMRQTRLNAGKKDRFWHQRMHTAERVVLSLEKNLRLVVRYWDAKRRKNQLIRPEDYVPNMHSECLQWWGISYARHAMLDALGRMIAACSTDPILAYVTTPADWVKTIPPSLFLDLAWKYYHKIQTLSEVRNGPGK